MYLMTKLKQKISQLKFIKQTADKNQSKQATKTKKPPKLYIPITS